MSHKVDTWHICISGFLQRPGKPHGIHNLWMHMRRLTGPGVEVQQHAWNTDWSMLADWIAISSSDRQRVNVNVYAFSWGAGWGFVQLAKALQARSIAIGHAVLSDPVYRSRLLTLRWLALVDWTWIKVPTNVRAVEYFLKRNSLPAGHRVGAANPNVTRVCSPRLVTDPAIGHTDMDSLAAFHLRCLEVAEEAIAV